MPADETGSATTARILDGTIATIRKAATEVTTIKLAQTVELAAAPTGEIDDPASAANAEAAAEAAAVAAAAPDASNTTLVTGALPDVTAAFSAVELAASTATTAKINGRVVPSARLSPANDEALSAGVQAILKGSNTDDSTQPANRAVDTDPLDAGVDMALSPPTPAIAAGK